jgi:hypothetical protein
MATGTAAALPPVRTDPRQVVNTLKATVNYSDANISTGYSLRNSLPAAAFITGVFVEIVTAFNAASTNVLTFGTNSSSYNDLVAAADVNEAVTGVYIVTRGLGRSIAASADKPVFAKYTQTGGAATTGQAVIVITYEGGWST